MIHKKLESILFERGMSQADLARKSGIGTSQIANIVRGNIKYPRFDTMEAIADALEISLDLFRQEKEKQNE